MDTANNKVVVDGESYALWPDGTFCRLDEADRHAPVLGQDYQEVIGIGHDDLLTVSNRSTFAFC